MCLFLNFSLQGIVLCGSSSEHKVFILTYIKNKTRHSTALKTISVTAWLRVTSALWAGKLIYTSAVRIQRNAFRTTFKKDISFSIWKSHNFLPLSWKTNPENKLCLLYFLISICVGEAYYFFPFNITESISSLGINLHISGASLV